MNLDEFRATFRREFHKGDEPEEALTAGLRAVLRECIEPMIAKAYADGSHDGYAFLRGTHEIDYARRIITAIVEN